MAIKKEEISQEKTEEKEVNKWWRPFWSSYFTPDELYEEAMKYFKYCDVTEVENLYWKKLKTPKTISWLAKWLWVSKNYLSNKAKEEGYLGMMEYIRWIVENDIEEKALIWLYNPTIASKNLSANFDWKDKSEVDQNISWELKTTTTVDKLNNLLNND